MRVGEHNLDQPEGTEEDLNVKKVVLHPKWDIGVENTPNGKQIYSKHDIALIELSSPVNFTSNVKSMCLDNGQLFKAGKKNGNLSFLVCQFLQFACLSNFFSDVVSDAANLIFNQERKIYVLGDGNTLGIQATD